MILPTAKRKAIGHMRMQIEAVIAVAVSVWVGSLQPLAAQPSADAARKPVEDTARELTFPDLPQWDISDPRLKEAYERYLDMEPEDFEPWPRWALEIVEDWKK